MGDRHRLFLACPVPPKVGEVIHSWATECAKTVPMRVTPATQLHVTILFFGEVYEDGKQELIGLTEQVYWKPFYCRLERGRLFGKNAFGIELSVKPEILAQFQRDIHPVWGSGSFKQMGEYVRDGERWSRNEMQLHITAGRTKQEEVHLEELPSIKSIDFELDSIVLYESFLGEGGSRYEELARAGF